MSGNGNDNKGGSGIPVFPQSWTEQVDWDALKKEEEEQQKRNNNGTNDSGSSDVPGLPPTEEIDWDAVMRDFSPPEWDLILSATAKNDLQGVQEMVERQGVPVNHANGIGQTALHVAALWGHVDVVRYLIHAGADANAANQLTGATPLHCALNSHKTTPDQQLALVQLLLEPPANADPSIEDKYGKCPAEYINANNVDHPIRRNAALMKRIAPPTPGVERLRAGMLRSVMQDLPTCSIACPPKPNKPKPA